MSTPRVFAETQALVERRGLRLQLLPECFDVDELDDVDALARLIETGAVPLPHTQHALFGMTTLDR